MPSGALAIAMVRVVREYDGFIALHAQQSWAERNQVDTEVLDASWVDFVCFYGSTRDLLQHSMPTLVYVNLHRGFLWPARMHLRTYGRMHALTKQLARNESAHTALRLMREDLSSFSRYPYACFISTMSTSLWRLMVMKCYEGLTYAGSATHEEALIILVQPVTCVLSYLCNADLQNVCWRLDWPSNYF